MSATEAAIKACTFSERYATTYQEMAFSPLLSYPEGEKALSKALFYHLAKIRYAGWQYRVHFGRGRKHSMSDIFQDLLAFYLRAALGPPPHGFEIKLEQSPKTGNKRSRVDILILKDEKPIFAIEVKTTVGWERLETEKAIADHLARIEQVAEDFGIRHENVIYVYEEPTNNGVIFEEKFWLKNKNKDLAERARNPGERVLLRPRHPEPFANIYPLFFGTDPLQWTWKELSGRPVKMRKNSRFWFPEIAETRFLQEAETRIVTPLEEVIDLILRAQPKA
jgi:hypothetical protein